MMKKRVLSIILTFLCIFLLFGCNNQNENNQPIDNVEKSNDIVVLFTNDVHCGIDDNIGYAGLSAYKKEMEENYNYVTLVDCGDFIQGAYVGAVTQGEYIVDIMNAVGYDYAIFGNHEFDYGMDKLEENVKNLDAKLLNCNVTYHGSGEDWLSTETIPYAIESYGDVKVAYIGVTTPWSISKSTPTIFMEDGEYVYDFAGFNGANYFYDLVQNNIDECKNQGADIVIVLSHLGIDTNVDTPFSSIELAKNTSGVDVILDAHSHVVMSQLVEKNKDGEDVSLASTGTKLSKIGKIVIKENKEVIEYNLIDDYTKKDNEIINQIENIRAKYQESLQVVVAHSDYDLLCTDNKGIRMVRSRELAIGDFVADAYRIIGNADIGLCNGGGIRADLKSGDITYEDIIAVNPYGNTLCVVEVTGAEILDMLEYFYRYVQADYKKLGRAVGEDGSFQQVSGLKFTINTSIASSVIVSTDDSLIGIDSTRRVSDVMVLKDGEYVPIELDQTYTVASHDYTIKNGGCGMLTFLADHKLIIDEAIADYQVLIDYLTMLQGDLSQYASVDNRITVK